MITEREFELYRTPEFIGAVEGNLLRAPDLIAFDKRIPFARELATRVKYLQKARLKLPSFYEARCIITPRAYEQSTSEAVAAGKRYKGSSCLDLTCGLGVDAFALSKHFDRLTTLERDPLSAEIARYNFGLLGTSNIEVINTTAEEYLHANPGLKYDFVYADPDRRPAGGRRMTAIEDCSPDIRSLLPRLEEVSGRVVIKLSPLFDVHEAFRIFGPRTAVTVISDAGECKEVLVETGSVLSTTSITARVTGHGEVTYPYGDTQNLPAPAGSGFGDAGYLGVPDVALTKSGISQHYYGLHGWQVTSPWGFAYGNPPFPAFGTRVYRIAGIEPYNPGRIKKSLKEKGIRRLTFLVRDFPYRLPQVVKQLGVEEGGTALAALMTVAGKQMFVFLDNPA